MFSKFYDKLKTCNMYDLDICRVCLNMNVRGCKMEEYNLRDAYEFIIRKKVNKTDGLPLWFCYECSAMLKKFVKFKDKCFKGQTTLSEILWKGGISYESIGKVDRYSENLVSSVGLIIPSKRVKTCLYRHIPGRGCITVKIEDSEYIPDTPFKKVTSPIKNVTTPLVDVTSPLEDEILVEMSIKNGVKDEHGPSEDKFDHEDNIMYEMVVDNASSSDEDLDTRPEQPTEHVTNPNNHKDGDNIRKIEISSSDSESPKPEPAKVKNGKKPVNKSNDKTALKKRKFESRVKKKLINLDHWIKINLNEEEVMSEFQKRAFSDKFLKANFKCRKCFKGFSKEAMLTRHNKMFHDEGVGALVCRFCQMRYGRKWKLSRHMMEHYIMYQCRRCDMRFRENSVAFHDDVHNGVMRKCKHCGKEFKHSSTYYTHIRMNHRSEHICKLCGASFVSERGLSQHTLITHFVEKDQDPSSKATEENYCSKCDIKFDTPVAYTEHLLNSQNHADDPDNVKGKKYLTKCRIPTTCTHCGDKFPTREAYKRHHLTSHLHIPYDRTICEVCGIALVSSAVPQHMVTHTGERPYPCALCGKRFTQKGAANKHYNYVHMKVPYPKYTRRTPRKRRKKADETPGNDFSPLLRAAFYS